MNAKKLNGYRASHRNKWLFIKYGVLSVQELSLQEFYADIFDFDPQHRTVGQFPVNFDEVAQVFSCSPNTVRNWHNKLLRLGFIKKTGGKNLYQLSCYSRYITPSVRFEGKAAVYAKQETNQSIEIILQNFEIDSQLVGEKVQTIGKKVKELGSESPSIAISSFKVESSNKDSLRIIKKVIIKQDLRTEEEYQKMYQDNPEGLEPEDMKWVDENVKEEIAVTESNEKEIVDMYFDGDWEKYRKNLVVREVRDEEEV
jgi:DNA-binding Lrp family transcriptional regulator